MKKIPVGRSTLHLIRSSIGRAKAANATDHTLYERLGLACSSEPRSTGPVMRVRWPFVLLLVSVMVALAPLAYIELPDQIWLGGLFDGGDEDDAIVQIQTQLNAVEPPALTLAPGSVPCIHAPPQLYECVASGPVFSARHTRAPPAP